MGCSTSSETKHVIYVKPHVANGTNSINGLKRISNDKTTNNNAEDVANHMRSDKDKGEDKKAKTESPPLPNNEVRRTVGAKNNVSGIKEDGDHGDSLDKLNGHSHNGEFTETDQRNSAENDKRLNGLESGKRVNRKFSDTKTKASSITEWETDSELALDKELEEVDAKEANHDKITRRTEAVIVKTRGSEEQQNITESDKTQDGRENVDKTGDETVHKKFRPVMASYVGSDGNENVGQTIDDSTVKAYASYVGSGNGEKCKDVGENRVGPHPSKIHQNTKDSITEQSAQTKHKEKTQKQQENKVNSEVSDAKTDTLIEEAHEQDKSGTEASGPAPTLVKAKDIMPSADVLKVLADQVKQSPIALKPSLGSLVKRLTKPAKTDLEKVWAFYRWIVINIKYDVEGFFGDAPAKSSDPNTILKTGAAMCEGYTNLVLAFCEKSDVEARVISGFAKPYGYTIGDDVSQLDSCKHKWNAVRIDGKWFLMDCTWGAGFVKPKDKRYIRWPNDSYFLTDPDIFISDHFPVMDNDYETSCKWQLLEMPLTLETFIKRVNMDQPGKEWGIRTHHHPYAVIDVQNESEIMIEESHTPMLDYMVHMRNTNYQLMDSFTFAYKSDAKTFKVHVRPPAIGEYMCQIYGRRVIDGKDAHFQPLVLYKLDCTEVYDRPREFPKHNTVFGPVPDIERFGFSHTGNVLYKAEFGEVTILLNPIREVHFVPHLYIGDTEFDYLRENCIVQYSEDFRHVTISLRLPFEGFFRLTLFGKQSQKEYKKEDDDDGRSSKSTSTPVYNVKFRRPQSNSSKKSAADELKPFVSYLIDNRQASDKDPFPLAHTGVLKYKCCLLQPTDKEVKTEREIKVCLRSLFLERVKAGDDLIAKVDETTFAGNTVTTKVDAKFIIYGSESKNGDDFVPLYECTTSR